MSGYTKLFNSILMSSVWEEPVDSRIVWVTLLALADQHGHVDGTIRSLARVARVSIPACDIAITTFLSPDPNDRSGVAEGRRIAADPGGWVIVNHSTYRHRMSEDERRERDKLRKRSIRAVSAASPLVSEFVRDVSQAEAEAEAEANTELVNTQSVKLSKTDMATKIYKIYPKKVGKDAAFKAIVSALGKISADELIEAVTAFAQISKGTDMQYIPNPATWFNQGRWADDRETWKPRTQGNAGARQPSTHATRSGHAETEQYEIPDL